MRPVGLLFPATLIAGILGLIPVALAHEYWLSPSSYRAGRGQEVAISALNGEGFAGERRGYARERTATLELHGERALDLMLAATEGDSIFARFVAPDDSGAVVIFVSNPTLIELPAERFESYLAEEGLEAVREARAGAGESRLPGRERFRRCAKTWVMGAGRAGARAPADRLLRPIGLPCEIVPVTDPLASETFRVRLLFRGEAVSGALLLTWRRPLGAGLAPRHPPGRKPEPAAAQARTNERGEAAFVLRGSGEWLVSAVHMVRSSDSVADWESYWASLTFARP